MARTELQLILKPSCIGHWREVEIGLRVENIEYSFTLFLHVLLPYYSDETKTMLKYILFTMQILIDLASLNVNFWSEDYLGQ